MPSPSRSRFGKLFDEIGTVDQVGIDERVAKFTTRSIKKGSKLWGLKTAVSMVDLTTLEGKDTPGKVASLCQKARRPSSDPDVPPVTAVGDGADEIDMVINRGLFLSGDFDAVQDEIAAVVEACGDAALKVILEVSELETFDNIRAASFLAM